MDLLAMFVAGLLVGACLVGWLWQASSADRTPLTKTIARVRHSLRRKPLSVVPPEAEHVAGQWIELRDEGGALLSRTQLWGALPQRVYKLHGRQRSAVFVRDGVGYDGTPQYRIEA